MPFEPCLIELTPMWSSSWRLQGEALLQFGLLTQACAGQDPPQQNKVYTNNINTQLQGFDPGHEAEGTSVTQFLWGVT